MPVRLNITIDEDVHERLKQENGVASVREGDAVAVFGGRGCGRCDYCVTGHEQLCESPQWAGLSIHDGGYAEYLLVPH